MTQPTKPVFILGVGAQKAGTSWLHQALHQQPSVDMGFTKEYHVWDARLMPELFEGLRIDAAAAQGGPQSFHRAMQTVDGFYERYFASLITGSVRVTGDITPSYSCLAAEHFSLIRGKLKAIGFDVRVVFLMRDPAQRIWSAARMKRRRAKAWKDTEMTDQQFIAKFETFFSGKGVVARTRYDRTIEALRQAFTPEELYFGLYENMFEHRSLRELSAFTSVDLTAADAAQRINASPGLALPGDVADRCRRFYAEVYDYCFAHFPQARELWQPPLPAPPAPLAPHPGPAVSP
jgi:hypothetical protein